MEVLLIVLGSILAIGAGFIAQDREQRIMRRREEQEVLLDINDSLLLLHAAVSNGTARGISGTPGDAIAEQRELLHLSAALSKLAVRLKLGTHRDIAVRISKLALDPPLRTPENIYQVTRDVQMILNPKVIARYEQEMSDHPDEF